jgi:hypothetical protein
MKKPRISSKPGSGDDLDVVNDDDLEITLGEKLLWIHLLADDIDRHGFMLGVEDSLGLVEKATRVVSFVRKLPLQRMDKKTREMMCSVFKRTSPSQRVEYSVSPRSTSTTDQCPGCPIRRRP